MQVLITTLVIILTVVVVLQLMLETPGGSQSSFSAATSKPFTTCLSDAQPCTSDVDCLLCTDKGSYQFDCQKPVSNQKGQSYCLPRKPRAPCNEKLGGVWAWTGWRDNTQGWTCNCIYPEIAGTPGCKVPNPQVCSQGQYTFDATKGPPRPLDCTCPANSTLVVSRSQVPLCIPRDAGLCSSDRVCKEALESLEL